VFFHDQHGLSRVDAGLTTAVCVFAGSFMRPVGGYLADRFGGVRVLTAVLLTATTLLGLMAAGPGARVAVALLGLLMAVLGTGNGSVFQLVPQRFGRDIGVATGTIGAAGGLGGFFLPNILGFLMGRTGSYGPGFAVFALGGLAVLGLVLSLRASWKRTLVAAGARV